MPKGQSQVRATWLLLNVKRMTYSVVNPWGKLNFTLIVIITTIVTAIISSDQVKVIAVLCFLVVLLMSSACPSSLL